MIYLVYQSIQAYLNNLEYQVSLVFYSSKVKTRELISQTDTRLLWIFYY